MSASELQLHAREFSALLDAIQDYAIFILTRDGMIRSWNAGAERTMGYASDEVIGRNFSIFYGPEDIASRKPQRELETAAREGRIEDEGWRVRKNGERFWVNTIITPLISPDGTISGFAKVTRDMTERREADERLRQSEEIFRLLVESVTDYAIFLLDTDGRIVTWNSGAEKIKGYTPEEIIGKGLSTFYLPEDAHSGKAERELDIARRTGRFEEEGWRVRKDGTRFWANVVISAVHDEGGNLRGFAKVTRDMTERKRADEVQQALLEQREARLRAEEERRRAEAAYRVSQEANRAKDEFLMTLSHELRTPLTSILGWTRLLMTMEPNDPAFDEALAAINRGAQLQARLIDDVLDVSRIVSGKLRLAVEEIEVAQVLSSALETVRPSAEARSIVLRSSIGSDLGHIIADGTRLQQVVWNLLSNAVKFTPKGGHVELEARRTSSHVQISVADSGEGMDPAFVPHVFEPFRQAEGSSTRAHGGLGLGLSIVRYIVEAHGGTVSAESQGRGRGSTFTLTIPIGAVRPGPQRASGEFNRVSEIPRLLEGMRLLLVDDDDDSRQLVRTVLVQGGATVTAVPSAARAIDAFRVERPDLLITDIAMPEVDGYALSRAIREIEPGQTIVALTAFPAGRNAADAAFAAYLMKPIDPQLLIEEVARIARRP